MNFNTRIDLYRDKKRIELIPVTFAALCCLAIDAFFCDNSAWALAQTKAATKSGQEISKSKQSSIHASWSTGNDGLVTFQFKTLPADGLKINTEGPWSLELKEHTDLDVEKNQFKRQDFDEKIAGFTFTGKPKTKNGTIGFKMVTFVCTENKTQCFRNVQQGSFAWHSK